MDSEDIFLTKDIYPIVAVWLQKKPGATGRAIERLAARCWDLGDRGRLSEIAGKNLREPPGPPGHYDLLCLVFSQGDSLF